jgi:hypothetical protein
MPLKSTKAIVAGIGATATAVSTWVAAVAVVASDDAIDLNEISAVITATVALVATVVGVWRVRNKPKPNPYR